MNWKKIMIPLVVALAVASIAYAGLRDRSSQIELYGDRDTPGNYIVMPELAAAPATADTGYGHVYVLGNDMYFLDDLGVATSLIGAASGNVANLDEAYDGGGAGAGREIAVDQGAVLLTGTNSSNDVMQIVAATSGDALDIEQSGAGKDIEGTSNTWSFSKAGLMTLANGATIDNGTDTIIEWNENSEEILWDFETNALDLDSTTGVVTLNVFDGSTGTITHAADGAADDFTLSMTGAQDTSLILSSSGTAGDALQITTSAGGIDITVAGGAAGEDIDIVTDTSINLSSTEDAASAIYLLTNAGTSESIVITNTQGTNDAAIDINGTAGGIDIDSGGPIGISSAENTVDSVVISSTAGGIDILASGAAATEDIDIVATGSSVNISSTEAAADAVVIAASTAVGGIDITSNADIDMTTTGAAGEDISITNTGGSVNISATEDIATAMVLSTSTGGIDITADGAAASDLDIVCTNGSTHISGGEAIADAVTIAAGAGGVDISAAATFDIDITATGGKILGVASEAAADQFKIDAQGAVAGNAINLETTDGGILLNADGAENGDIGIDAADDLTLTAAGDMTLAVTGTVSAGGSPLTNWLQNTEVVTAANTITAAECGKVFFLSSATEFASALPALSTVSAGCAFEFIVDQAPAAASYTVTTGNSLENNIWGLAVVNGAAVAGADEDTITFTDAAAVKGDWVSVQSDGGSWYVKGQAVAATGITLTQAD